MNNLHVRNLRKNRAVKKKTAESGFPFFSSVLKLIGLAVMVFAIVNVRISYNEKAENLNRESVKIKRKIHKLNREIEHLNIRKEALSSWPNVKKRIDEHQLALRMPAPSQVSHLALNKADREPDEDKITLSQR